MGPAAEVIGAVSPSVGWGAVISVRWDPRSVIGDDSLFVLFSEATSLVRSGRSRGTGTVHLLSPDVRGGVSVADE